MNMHGLRLAIWSNDDQSAKFFVWKIQQNIYVAFTFLKQLYRYSQAQYVYCYDVISAFLESFDDQMYDNFKKAENEDNYPETTMDDKKRLVSKF